ncbi:DUF2218 domain-containing protein [Acidisoma sp. 7E03]
MSQRLPCHTRGRLTLESAGAYLRALCATARSYAEVEERGDFARLDLGYAAMEVKAADGAVALTLRATDAGTIAMLQTMVTEHLREHLQNNALCFDWLDAPPRARRAYRRMTVTAAQGLTLRMRRITLTSDDLSPFAEGGLHVSLFLPEHGLLPEGEMAETGRMSWQGEAPPVRAYTIRAIDLAASTVDIDMLLHPAHGTAAPGADFAERAAPGVVIGMAGPGGGRPPESPWIFMAGDETALPAIARTLETLSPSTTAVVRIEVTDQQDELPLPSPARLDLAWLHRGHTPAARSRLLLDALAQAPFPDAGLERFAWFAAEAEIAREAKAWFRGRPDFTAADYFAGGFWRAE